MILRNRPVRAWRWVAALAVLAVVSVVMLGLRASLDKSHVAMLYLLVVLAGSTAGGRALGVTLGILSFFSFNFLFLRPYYTLTISEPLDWLVLVTFLATSLVAAELLDRQQKQEALAEQRARELDQLATLGAETVNAPRAEQALAAIAEVIRTTAGAGGCRVFVRATSDGQLRRLGDDADPEGEDHADSGEGDLLQYIVHSGRAAIEREDGTIRVIEGSMDSGPGLSFDDARALAIPLSIRGTTVGVLRLSGIPKPGATLEQLRVVQALAYYAALGTERLRLQETEESTESLRRADRLKDSLLASVSHDLRTPLTTIKGIAHEIVLGGDPERALVIEEEADRLSVLVEGLLELSQLDADALPLRIEVNTVDDLVGAAIQRADSVLQPHPVEVDLGDSPLLVGRFDFAHSLRILVNLLDNAAKYSPPGAPIELSVRRFGDELHVSVSDRGIGISAEDVHHIFEPFFRAPGTPPDVRGAGLGLAIARRIARAQGGDLTAEPRLGGGTTFTVRLTAAELPTE